MGFMGGMSRLEHDATTFHILLFLQYTGCGMSTQFIGTRTLHVKPTAGGITTTVLTFSTGSLTTALQILVALLRWGLPGCVLRNFCGCPCLLD